MLTASPSIGTKIRGRSSAQSVANYKTLQATRAPLATPGDCRGSYGIGDDTLGPCSLYLLPRTP